MGRFETEQEFIDHFDERYEHALSPLMLDIEEETQGTRVGASNWSTLDQLARVAVETGLEPGDHLLEIGCGTGWAGTRVAAETGASLTLTDLPFNAVSLARDAAANAGVEATTCVADVRSLPFSDGTFNAITHSDVLCCLSGKQKALEECRRVLTPDGKMVFTVLLIDETLSPAAARERMHEGSEYIVSDRPYNQMMTSAGFTFVSEDWTDEFATMAGRLDKARRSRADALKEMFGAEEAQGLVDRPRWNLEVVAEGMLKRRLYVAEPC